MQRNVFGFGFNLRISLIWKIAESVLRSINSKFNDFVFPMKISLFPAIIKHNQDLTNTNHKKRMLTLNTDEYIHDDIV